MEGWGGGGVGTIDCLLTIGCANRGRSDVFVSVSIVYLV